MSDNSRLAIPAVASELLEQEAIAAYPEECCGVLLGNLRAREPWIAEVHEVVAAENRAAEERWRRYTIDPAFLLRAQRESRRSGLDVVGYYHSHPDHPAVPSRYDLETAWPGVAYLILALEGRRVKESRCWRLVPDCGSFAELDIGYP